MRVVLIGADNEENLGIAMLAASLGAAGHRVRVVPFSSHDELSEAATQAMAHRPQLIGLAMQFQHRGWEFTELADKLRQARFQGHLTAGGQFATMAHEPLLMNTTSLDSVVLYDGEHTIVELVDTLVRRGDLRQVAGLALRLDDGCVKLTAARQLPQELDLLPVPQRYRAASKHFGVPFIPMSGGRGCWGRCAFCSITSFYGSARKQSGGLGLRLRSPSAIAQEMAVLTEREQAPSIFCFHDETLLLPRPSDTMKRLNALTEELERLGVEGYGIVGKCRPDCVTPELAKDLAASNVIRLYVGIENASQAGQDHLSRRTHTDQLDAALTAINSVGIFGCYNLLIFEPQVTLNDVRENIAFIRKFPQNPVNFCRAEPYHGTPLWEQLKASGKLEGSWLGWDYHLEDPAAETLFRVTASAFRQRNFDCYGVANRSMSVGYMAKVLKHFYPGNGVKVASFEARARDITEQVTRDTADRFEEALHIVERLGTSDRDAIERETAVLGLKIAERDATFHALIDQFVDDAERYVAEQRRDRRVKLPLRLYEALTGLALASCLVAVNPGCGGETDDPQNSGDPPPPAGGRASTSVGGAGGFIVADPLPNAGGYMVYDPLPTSGGVMWDSVPSAGGRGGSTGTATTGYGGMDPVPSAGGRGGASSTSSGGYTAMTVDPLPSTGGRGGSTGIATSTSGSTARGGAGGATTSSTRGYGGMVADPVPSTGGRGGATSSTATTRSGGASSGGVSAVVDPLPSSGGLFSAQLDVEPEMRVGHFRDTRTRRTVRSRELPLFDPPEITLESKGTQGGYEVQICGAQEPLGTRWKSRGKVEGDGLAVRWSPADPDDQVSVAVRTTGGVTVAALRVKDLCCKSDV